MATRILMLIEDDWEIGGNGLGDVAERQYLPALFAIRIAKEFGITYTFMVEVLQQLAFNRFPSKNRRIDLQRKMWDETVCLMKEEGQDVQLHLHPQWWKASFENGMPRVKGSWNIADYPSTERQRMISDSIAYLKSLLNPIDPQYRPIAFKAGAWAMQPSAGILRELMDAGIKIIMGPGKATQYRSSNFLADYSQMEEDTLPYHADIDDVARVGKANNSVIVLPMPYYHWNWLEIVKKGLM